MQRTFTMTRAQVMTDATALKAAITDAAGSESGAESIMRSLERLGTDESIEYFEMTEIASPRRFGGAGPTSWRVRADRGIQEEPTTF